MIFEKIKSILSEQFDIEDPESITMGTNLREDLDADSLDLADLLATLEDEFEIEASDDIINSISTVEDIVNYISEIKNAQ